MNLKNIRNSLRHCYINPNDLRGTTYNGYSLINRAIIFGSSVKIGWRSGVVENIKHVGPKWVLFNPDCVKVRTHSERSWNELEGELIAK